MRRLPHFAASDKYPGTLPADGRRPSIPTTVGMLWAFLSAEVSSPLRMSSSRTARSVSSPRLAHPPGRPASLRVHSGEPSVACPPRAAVAVPASAPSPQSGCSGFPKRRGPSSPLAFYPGHWVNLEAQSRELKACLALMSRSGRSKSRDQRGQPRTLG